MTQRLGGLLVIAVAVAGCGSSVCDKKVDLSAKAGDCVGLTTSPLLGDSSTCSMRLSPCIDADKTAISSTLDCLQALPTCASGSKLSWETQQKGCYDKLQTVSAGCKLSLFGPVLPGEDAGYDAGPPPDAGTQSIDDGGHGVSFVAVADEKNFAFAWVPLQPAGIMQWELNIFDVSGPQDGGVRLSEQYFGTGATRTYELLNAGPDLQRRFYVAGIAPNGLVAKGVPEDAGGPVDAGAMNCTQHSHCTQLLVCDLGVCKTQLCMMNSTCPQPDYVCNVSITPHYCERTGGSMMGIDAGNTMGGANASLMMISPAAYATTGPAKYHETTLGGYVAKRPDMVAIDSARQFVVLEQGGQPVGHYTISRGKDFVSDQQSASIIDTLGANPHVAFNSENNVIYACYQVGQGVRVRRSRDYGRTWGTDALTITPVDDGGSIGTIGDCDIAAWKNGTALLVTVDDDTLVLRQVNEILQELGAPQTVFTSSPTDGGGYNIFGPQRPEIATLPSADITHIGFTGSRLSGPITDSDIFGIYRDTGTGGTFSQPMYINSPGGTMMGTGQPQDFVSLEIDPVTKRPIAAWTALENQGGVSYSTVYLGFFLPTKRWVTGADLTVFIKVQNSYPLFPGRPQTDQWDAWSPKVGINRDGRMWLMFLAGKRDTPSSDIFAWQVGFDLDAGSPVGVNTKGWFLPPAQQMSTTKAVDARAAGNFVPSSNTAFATDSQLSTYGVFVEGIGPINADENRGVFVSRP